jgi:hypothetical protein
MDRIEEQNQFCISEADTKGLEVMSIYKVACIELHFRN